jgi:hypothetical protein
MTRTEILETIVRTFVRELLTDGAGGEPRPSVPFPVEPSPPPQDGPGWAQPRFDFADPRDDPAFGAMVDAAREELAHEQPPSEDELDALAEVEGGPMARARRIAAREAEKAARRSERLFPEDLEMKGMGPPAELP